MLDKLLAFYRDSILRARPLRLLVTAACLHLLIAVAIYTAGRLSILPEPFANGSERFAFDTLIYQQGAEALTEVLSNDGIGAWLRTPSVPHVRLYSLSYFLFKPLFGYSTLALEPLNLLYYLASLLLVYRIGKEAFERDTGVTAATLIALWPSFLLHTTQVLKDPLFIVCMLALVCVWVIWLKAIGSWKGALLTVLPGVTAVAILAWMKSNMWESVLVLTFIGCGLLLVRQAHARRIFIRNLLSAALLVTFTLVVPIRSTLVHQRDQQAVMVAEQEGQSSYVWVSLGSRIAQRRRAFSRYRQGQGSMIDGDVFFNSTSDIVRFLPRATLTGLFAPFPQMWFASAATTGRAARLLSGAETFLFYFAALAAGFCAYAERRNFAMWLLLLVALINIVALGLVVPNIGTLFRLRYVFWMLIIILGARGSVVLARRFCAGRAAKNMALAPQTHSPYPVESSPGG
ncbi:MAG TPA: hypothetical protein VEV81_11925 [Pyrinomonadaceae bacterium]|nr:hypothetical protein [Pyrinomonadaceae bacterium]